MESLFIISSGLSLLVSLVLVDHGIYQVNEAFRKGIFEAVSIATTTGSQRLTMELANFYTVLNAHECLHRCCAGSTGGGIKIIRMLLLYKQGAREIKRLIHPNAVIPIKIGRKPVGSRVIEAVWGFWLHIF